MGMILYHRDLKGNIDKSSTTYLESLELVNEGIKEFLDDSDLQKDINSLKSTTRQQDVMIMETDLRVMDLEFILEEFANVSVNLSASTKVDARTSSFDLLSRMILEENYTSKEQMKSTIQKYYDRHRITEEEYEELNRLLYPSEL